MFTWACLNRKISYFSVTKALWKGEQQARKTIAQSRINLKRGKQNNSHLSELCFVYYSTSNNHLTMAASCDKWRATQQLNQQTTPGGVGKPYHSTERALKFVFLQSCDEQGREHNQPHTCPLRIIKTRGMKLPTKTGASGRNRKKSTALHQFKFNITAFLWILSQILQHWSKCVWDVKAFWQRRHPEQIRQKCCLLII